MRPLSPARRVRRWHTYLVLWTVHRVLGLSAGLLLTLLSFTGGLLVLHHDIERGLGGPYRVAPGADAAAPRPYGELLAAAAVVAPADHRPYRLMPAAAPDETAKVIFVAPDGVTRWTALVDPFTATVRWSGADQSLFTPWLLHLHMHLHLGPWGYAITGLAGAALVALGLTGIYLHRYDLAAIWRRPPVRFRLGWRVWLHDAHTWVGAVSLYFSLVLGATGLAFAILILPGQLKPRAPVGEPYDFTRLAAIEPMIAAARAALPGQQLVRIAWPTAAGAPLRLLWLDRSAPVWAKFSTTDFDAQTSELLRVRRGREATTKEKWRAIVAPLHFGFYGAPWVKAAYAVGGFAPGLLALTGVALWWRRTRRRGSSPTMRTPTRAAFALDR